MSGREIVWQICLIEIIEFSKKWQEMENRECCWKEMCLAGGVEAADVGEWRDGVVRDEVWTMCAATAMPVRLPIPIVNHLGRRRHKN